MTGVLVGCAALIALMITRLVLGYARMRLLDQPNERSSHQIPTPRGGGLGLVVGLLVAAVIGLVVYGSGFGAVLLIPIFAMAALGWWDDHASLSARLRLGLQMVLVGMMVWGIGVPESVVAGGWTIPVPSLIVVVLLVVGGVWLVNLTNFMDGIDGIAGTQGVVGCGGLALLVLPLAADPVMASTWVILVACGGACVGFLVWNWPPARIFLGDVGSTTLGLVFAIGVTAGMHGEIAIEVLLLPLMPFVADATCTLMRRAWRGERLSQAHRSHLYQRLARHWGRHAPVTVLYGLLALLGGGLALMARGQIIPSGVGIGGWCVCFAVLSWYGHRVVPATPAVPVLPMPESTLSTVAPSAVRDLSP